MFRQAFLRNSVGSVATSGACSRSHFRWHPRNSYHSGMIRPASPQCFVAGRLAAAIISKEVEPVHCRSYCVTGFPEEATLRPEIFSACPSTELCAQARCSSFCLGGTSFDLPVSEWCSRPPWGSYRLGFGSTNQPIAGVSWLASLKQLSFGHWFDQPIAGVVGPVSLQQLSFGSVVGCHRRFSLPSSDRVSYYWC